MADIPTWVTPAGSLGTIPEGVFYRIPLAAEAVGPVYYQVIAGSLPPGIQIDETGVLSGNPKTATKVSIEGIPLDVTRDTTSTFAIRAYTERDFSGVTVLNGLADRTFSLTISGQSVVSWVTPAGSIGTYIDGVQITDLALSYIDSDEYNIGKDVVTLIAGALPPGLSVSKTGIISGYITPNPNATVTDMVYSFTLRVANNTSSDVRTFSITVYARNLITADNSNITADNTYINTDTYPIQPPIITTPTGSIGTTRSDNYFAFQFTGLDFNNNAFQFIATDFSPLPPGLTLDPNSGWLYGYIPYGGVASTAYTFSIVAREVNNPSNFSNPYYYSLTITGPINSDVVWLTPSDPVQLAATPSSLGTIDNGTISTFYVEAQNVEGLTLQYQLLSGSDSRLPQGLQLLSSGHIAGRVSFDTFALDGGTTTFDVNLNTVKHPTTFDLVAIFTVQATSSNGLVNVNKTFSITVIRRYQEPYDNLYIQCMPPENDRALLNSLLQNPTVFTPSLIYRADDPNFGIASRVIYDHAYGLTAATLDEYVNSLQLNHYWKQLTLGQIKTARAVDDNGNIIYEVVYSQVVDNLVNNDGVSVGKEVVLPFPLNRNTPSEIDVVYPNSLEDMRTQVVDVIGQVSNVLPRWMTSKQADGSVLGFTPAWVIAYTVPNQSGQIAYNIETFFGQQLNLIDFKADRYELDNYLTRNWNRDQQYWGFEGDTVTPHPPSLTTFDFSHVKASWINDSSIITTWEDNLQTLATWTYGTPPGTTFDGNSLLFTAPVDMYSPNNTTKYDKYLLFPKYNILNSLPNTESNNTVVSWFNEYSQFVTWVNNASAAVTWVNSAG